MSEQTVGLGGNGAAPTTSSTTTTTATAASKRGTVTSDPQLVACIKIDRTLASLSDDARAFVLNYIQTKYTV